MRLGMSQTHAQNATRRCEAPNLLQPYLPQEWDVCHQAPGATAAYYHAVIHGRLLRRCGSSPQQLVSPARGMFVHTELRCHPRWVDGPSLLWAHHDNFVVVVVFERGNF